MHPDDHNLREMLAAALRGEAAAWPAGWGDDEADVMARAAFFHGVAGLLIERSDALENWPAMLLDRLRDEARARAMWELRHRQLLADLLADLDRHGIRALLMKGTAVAYDLYDNPACRTRSDSDLLVARDDVPDATSVLAGRGYKAGVLGGVTPEFALQQVWVLDLPDGGSHVIDLHWQVMNAPSLKDMLPFEECWADARRLPRLSLHAWTMDRVRLLLHTCLHRAMQHNAPYFVDGVRFFDPARLIWSVDIHLIAEALDENEWLALGELAGKMGISHVCQEALQAAQSDFDTRSSVGHLAQLAVSGSRKRDSAYFIRSPALSRARQDLQTFSGVAQKLRYVLSRIFTTEAFVRGKYPELAGRPLPFLYARRFIDLIRHRARADDDR